MMELTLLTRLDEDQKEYLRIAKTCGDSLLRIVNDILDFSKIEARKLTVERVPFALNDILNEAVSTVRFRCDQKGIALQFEPSASVPSSVVGDPHRLKQILMNLLNNAVKFTHQGKIGLSTHLRASTADAITVEFQVSDTGVGIPFEKRKSIFEAFSQADASSTRRFGGTGIGLTICSQLAQLMNGSIWVNSEVGRGSTFHFTAEFGIVGNESYSERSDEVIPTAVV
jgi:signal transduction histidine kinase